MPFPTDQELREDEPIYSPEEDEGKTRWLVLWWRALTAVTRAERLQEEQT